MIDSSTELIPNAFYFSLDPFDPKVWIDKNNLEELEWGLKYFPCKLFPNRIVSSPTQHVLVTGGGSDANDFTLALYKSILDLNLENLHFHIFSKNLNRSDENERITIYPLGEDLIQVLEKCKFVISSAGTSIWDFLVNSRTLAIVKSVENQTRNYKFVVENTLAIGIGEWKDGKWNLDIEKLNNFLTSSPTSPKIDVSKIGLDFMGSERFVDKVLEKFNFFE
jgi:hypothetical protein